MANFFSKRNLNRLREMTLSESANFLDRQQRQTATSEPGVSAIGQVMVAISSRGPDSGKLLRKTARLAAQLNGNWYAVYVRTPEESAVKISAEDQRRVTDTLETAQKMGGLVILLKGEDVAQALVAFAREYGITHIVIGRPGKSKPWQLFRTSLHNVLIRELPNVDFIIT